MDKDAVNALLEDLPEAEEPGRSGYEVDLRINVAFSMRLRAAAMRSASHAIVGQEDEIRSESSSPVPNVSVQNENPRMRDGSAPLASASPQDLSLQPLLDYSQAHEPHSHPPPPKPHVEQVGINEGRDLRRQRFKRLREIFAQGCQTPHVSS